MERVKYTRSYEPDTEPFWYTEFTEGNLTIANAPMDFKEVLQKDFNTYKLRDRNNRKRQTICRVNSSPPI